MEDSEPKIKAKLKFGGIFKPGELITYPCYMYKDGHDPLRVKDTKEADAAYMEGYDQVNPASMSNKVLSNWYWDLEDMSSKQLSVFAMDEYGVDLPQDGSQAKLFDAVLKIARWASKNKNIIFMAHSIKMEYDETLREIRRAVETPMDGYVTEVFTEEFEA